MPLSKEEAEELARLEAQVAASEHGPASVAPGLTDAEKAELAQLEAQYALTPVGALKAGAKGAVNVVSRALDYPMGLARMGVAAVAQPVSNIYTAATGQAPRDIVKEEDILNTLTGNAPSFKTLLNRAEAPDMGSVQLPGILGGQKLTGKEILAGGLELGTGLLTGKGLSRLSKAESKLLSKTGQILNAPQEAVSSVMNAGGKKLYRSGMKGLDRAAELAGKSKTAVSDLLGSKNIWGSPRSIQEASDVLVNDLQKKVEKAIAQATKAGKTVDMATVLAPVQNEARAMLAAKGTPSFKGQVQGFLGQVDDLVQQQLPPEKLPLAPGSPYTVMDAQNVKQQIYGMLNDPAYQIISNQPIGKKLLKSGVRAIKEGIEEQVPGVKELNADLGVLLSAKKKIASEVTKDINRNAITTVGTMSMVKPELGILKHLGDLSKMSSVRTGGGLLLQNPTVQRATSQAIIGATGDRGEQGDISDNIQQVVERLKQQYGSK